MKDITSRLAVAILAFNVVLMGTFTYSAVTKTQDIEPWHTIVSLGNKY